jgi:hypothetical protein
VKNGYVVGNEKNCKGNMRDDYWMDEYICNRRELFMHTMNVECLWGGLVIEL